MMTSNKQGAIFVHICTVEDEHLQWNTKISKHDSFDDLRKRLIKQLPKDQIPIIDCLKIKHKLKLIIDDTEYYLHQNVFLSINIENKPCIWFIGCSKNSFRPSFIKKPLLNTNTQKLATSNHEIFQNTFKNLQSRITPKNADCNASTATPILTDGTSHSKHTKNQRKNKRNRVDMDGQPRPKKRKISALKPECIWLFIDMAPTMDTILFEDITKAECVQHLVEELVQNTWSRAECVSNHIRLFTFSNQLKDLTQYPYRIYSESKAQVLMTKLRDEVISASYEECMSWRNALKCLLDVVIEQKYNKENVNLSLERNRIILLTDAERGRSMDIEMKEIAQKLRHNVTLDVIHVTQTKRCNKALQELCAHDNIGKYWNPPLKSLSDYLAIMRCDIMANTTLRDSSSHVIELE